MNYHISTIAKITGGQLLRRVPDRAVFHLLTDSRRLLFPETTVFFALLGPARTGGEYIPELYEKGVRCFVVDTRFSLRKGQFPGAAFISTTHVLRALQKLASWHRRQFHYPVIGITGSNGKTIVKEWLYQLLHDRYEIVRSPKSYNSQLGVPLSVWAMQPAHELALFEAGISQRGEMRHLQRIIRPDTGIFTTIGDAHNEGFRNRKEKVSEKMLLFSGCRHLIYCSDKPEIEAEARRLAERKKGRLSLLAWGSNPGSVLQILHVKKSGNGSVIRVQQKPAPGFPCLRPRVFTITIPFTDAASVENALHALCLLLHLGLEPDDINSRMKELRPLAMRLELKKGLNDCSVINDSYSADIHSLSIALDFMQQQKQHPLFTVILSDFRQSGKSTQVLYRQIASILQGKKINRLIGVGAELSAHHDLFASIPRTEFFATTADLREALPSLAFHRETILLKGARSFGFEQISRLLEEKAHQTVLEIDLNALAHNLRQHRLMLAPAVKTMAMVKAFSYGSGSFEIANLLQFHKIDYLAVAYTDEGVELRKAGIRLPIMVMSPDEAGFEQLVEHQLEPEIYSFAGLGLFANYLRDMGLQHYPIHLKIDTGMHRLGFLPDEVTKLAGLLQSNACMKVQSAFTHLVASSDPAMDGFTRQQAQDFDKACNQLERALGYRFIRHLANSSAIHRHISLQRDMVRLGIGLYGIGADPTLQRKLKNVTTLKTTIAQIKQVRAGDTVGYGRSGKIEHDSEIATVRIGYADGYSRRLGNGVGYMLVKGQRAPVVGHVCMDMTMIDITGIGATEGDEVLVFGEALPVSEVAGLCGTIPYEILTGVSQRVRRVYFEE
jgi:alanine racemase